MKKNVLKFLPYGIFLIASLLPFLLYGNHVISSPYINNQFFNLQKYFDTLSHTNKGGFTYYFIPFDIVIYFFMQVLPQSLVIELSDAVITFIAFVSSYKLARFLFKDNVISILF